MTVNYPLWVTMVGQCSFISCDKPITPVQGVDKGGSSACAGTGSVGEIFNPVAGETFALESLGILNTT